MATPTKDNLRQIAKALRQVRAVQRGPSALPLPLPRIEQTADIQDVEVTSLTATSDRYPGVILEYDSTAKTYTQGATCWVVRRDGTAPELKKYAGKRWGEVSEVPVFLIEPSPLTVQDDDANPSYTGVHTLQFDQDDGFSLSNPSAGVVKVDFTGGSSITVEEQDGSPSYAATNTLQFEEDDGFVVSQPSANKALVRLTGTVANLTVTNLTTTTLVNNSTTWLQVVTLSSSQNNYAVGAGVTLLIINATANINITGIAISGGNTIDRPLLILNVGAANTVTLVNQSGSSSTANQFTLPAAGNITLAAAGGQMSIDYNAANTTWYAAGMSYPAVASMSSLSALSVNVLTMFGSANNAAILSNIGAQALDATLTALAALTIAANSLTIGTGADAFSQTTFAASTFPARPSSGDLAAQPITDWGLGVLAASTLSGTEATLSATGSVQGDAAAIVTDCVTVTNADGTKGIILPNTAGAVIRVYNNSGVNTLKVYPNSSAAIGPGAVNAAFSVVGVTTYLFFRVSSVRWGVIAGT